MRILACGVLLSLAALAPAAAAPVEVLRAEPAGPAVVGQTVDIVVQARAAGATVDGAWLTWPDLQGELGGAACPRPGARAGAVRRFSIPYVPRWAGTHVLTVTVRAGLCGSRPTRAWRAVELEAAPPPPASAGPAVRSDPRCPAAGDLPLPRTMRAARLAVVCLLNGERRARGLRALRTDRTLRRAASRRAHRGGRLRPGEQRATATASSAAPERVLATWLASDANRPGLLAVGARRVGVSVVPRPIGPLRRPGAGYVVLLR